MTCSQIRCLMTVLSIDREQKNQRPVMSKDIADRLSISRPSAHRLLESLSKAHYIIKEAYGPVILTEEGRHEALRMEERCRNLTQSLLQRYRLTPDEGETAAMLLMSRMTEESLQAIESA